MSTLMHAKDRCLRTFIIVLLIGLILPTGSVLAQDSSPHARKEEALLSDTTRIMEPPIQNADSGLSAITQAVQDGGFEAYDPFWKFDRFWTAEVDSYFGTPLCNSSDTDCGTNLNAHPHTGDNWARFGGAPNLPFHNAYLSQTVTFPACGNGTLKFYFWIGYAGPGSGTDDVFYAKLNGTPVFSADATQIALYSSYTEISVDVSSFAPGIPQTLEFSHSNTEQNVIFNLDDVSLEFTPCLTVSGNIGAPGVIFKYVDGIRQKQAVSVANGNYSLQVASPWSGVVTPSHPCYTFSPASRAYTDLTTGIAGQDFTALFNNTPECGVTVGVFRPNNGLIYLKNSNFTGYSDVDMNYGIGGDYPIAGDWDGDGVDTTGVYRNGVFYLRNSNTPGNADVYFTFGQAGDQPVAGDWDGDGFDTIGVYRSWAFTFYLRNTNTPGAPDIIFSLGIPGDIGIAGDWDGDDVDTTGVFRPGNGMIFLKHTNVTGYGDIAIHYGLPNDKPVTGDWDSDGIDTIGVLRGNHFYLRNNNTVGDADLEFFLGLPGDMPIAGNWDGKP